MHIYIFKYSKKTYMSSGQNNMLNVMPYTNYGRPLSVVRTSTLSGIASKNMS